MLIKAVTRALHRIPQPRIDFSIRLIFCVAVPLLQTARQFGPLAGDDFSFCNVLEIPVNAPHDKRFRDILDSTAIHGFAPFCLSAISKSSPSFAVSLCKSFALTHNLMDLMVTERTRWIQHYSTV
jgi:hypothetical protein